MKEEFRKNFSAFEGYNVERIAYTKLFKIYKDMEEKHDVPIEDRLVLPKYYGADTTYLQETIVLEDLSRSGYELHDRFESVDWPFATSAITELAKFHALSFAYQNKNPDEFEELLKDFPTIEFLVNDNTEVTCKHSVELAINAVRENHKEKLKKFVEGLTMKSFSDLITPLRHKVLVHGDFRPSNMLYRERDDSSIEVIPIDFQTIQIGCPVSDLVYFITGGTDRIFRTLYYTSLVEHYYSELGNALDRFELYIEKIYPREDFDFELKQKLPYGLKLSVIGLPLGMTSEDESMKPEEFNFGAEMSVKPGALYETKLNEIVDTYVVWGVLVD